MYKYLTDKEQKISWHSFLRHGVVSAELLVILRYKLYSDKTVYYVGLERNIMDFGSLGGFKQSLISSSIHPSIHIRLLTKLVKTQGCVQM